MMSCTSYMIVLTHILRVVHVSAGIGARNIIPSIVALLSRLRAYSSQSTKSRTSLIRIIAMSSFMVVAYRAATLINVLILAQVIIVCI